MVAHPYTAAQASLPIVLFIVVVSPRACHGLWRSPGGHGRRRGPASALASLAQFARASAFPVFLPSADCSLLMSMAPEDGLLADPLVRRGDVRSSPSPLAGSGLMSLL